MSLFVFAADDFDPAAFRPTPGNAEALRAIAVDELRRVRMVWLHGPAGCGKSHLLAVAAAAMPTARRMTPQRLRQCDDDDWFGAHLLLDDADRVEDPALLLRVMNAVREGGGTAVFAARVPPARVAGDDEALRSRLLSLAAISIL